MEQTKLIVAAIESLQGGLLQDLFYPLMVAIFGTVLAAGVAYFTVKSQENIQIEKTKMEVANEWVLKIDEARENLLAVKRNYHGLLNAHPLIRLTTIPTNPLGAKYISAEYEKLSFISPKGRISNRPYRWSQIPRIRAMVSNYNELMGIWQHRHVLNEEFKLSILKGLNQDVNQEFTLEDAVRDHGANQMIRLIESNETAIVLTDRILIELDDFVVNFPHFVATKIKTKRLKRFGTLLAYHYDGNGDMLYLLRPSPEGDYRIIEQLFGEPATDIRARYDNLM